MQTATQQGYTTSVPVREQSGEEFVFYAGDVIPLETKTRNPDWKRGGIVVGNETLLYNGGYIPRCEITALRDHFHSEPESYADPLKKESMVRTYQATENGVTKTMGVTTNRLGEQTHDKLLRTPIYPRQEIQRIAGKGDGVVRMPVTRADRDAMQYFLFPNWDELVTASQFPATIEKLRSYFVGRRNAAQTKLEENCADAAILSCDQYSAFQRGELAKQIATYERAKQKGHPFTFGGRAELLFTQFGEQRPDRVSQNQAGQIGDLTAAMTKFVEASTQNQTISQPSAGASVSSETLRELEELRKFKAEQEAQKTLATADETVSDKVKCAATTSGGEPCKNDALENGYCRNPGHQKLAEKGEE